MISKSKTRHVLLSIILIAVSVIGIYLPGAALAKWYGQAESYNGEYLAVIRNTHSSEYDVVGGPYKNKNKAKRKAKKAAKKANKKEESGVMHDPSCDNPLFNC